MLPSSSSLLLPPPSTSPVPQSSSSMALANEMISKRVRERTVSGYIAKLKIMGRWLSVNGGRVDPEGLPTLPLNQALTINFFGCLIEPRLSAHEIWGKPRKKVTSTHPHHISPTLVLTLSTADLVCLVEFFFSAP